MAIIVAKYVVFNKRKENKMKINIYEYLSEDSDDENKLYIYLKKIC